MASIGKQPLSFDNLKVTGIPITYYRAEFDSQNVIETFNMSFKLAVKKITF